MSVVIHPDPLPYDACLARRPLAAIDLVVIHCTELPDLATAREYGEQVLYGDGSGNSGHYYIDRDGSLSTWVEPDRIAHHVRGFNPRSVGIELVNRGRWPHWLDAAHQSMDEAYPPVQIEALRQWLLQLQDQLPGLHWIAGHEDLDTAQVPASDDPGRSVRRKRDPGPCFPWPQVMTGLRLQRLTLDATD